MSEEIEQLKIDNQELLEDNTWWQRRFNAVQRDYENLQAKIDKAIEYIKCEKVIKEGNTLEQITNYEKNF